MNGDCVYEPDTDLPLAGVQIDLLNAQGHVIATTTTDVQGNYEFDDLDPGVYSVFEHQPTGYVEGMDMVGTVGGVTVGEHGGTDRLTEIALGPGDNGINYDFCEELPASIAGKVWNDTNGDCVYRPANRHPLSGVQIDLLERPGHVVATTTDRCNGATTNSTIWIPAPTAFSSISRSATWKAWICSARSVALRSALMAALTC